MTVDKNAEYAGQVVESVLQAQNLFELGQSYALFAYMSFINNEFLHDHEKWGKAHAKGNHHYSAFLEQLNDMEISLLPLDVCECDIKKIRDGLDLAFEKNDFFACGYYVKSLSISLKHLKELKKKGKEVGLSILASVPT